MDIPPTRVPGPSRKIQSAAGPCLRTSRIQPHGYHFPYIHGVFQSSSRFSRANFSDRLTKPAPDFTCIHICFRRPSSIASPIASGAACLNTLRAIFFWISSFAYIALRCYFITNNQNPIDLRLCRAFSRCLADDSLAIRVPHATTNHSANIRQQWSISWATSHLP